MNLVPYMRSLQELRHDLHRHLSAAARSSATATGSSRHIGSDYGGVARQREVDQVVVNHGTMPLDELYFELKPLSRNLGEVSHDRADRRRAAVGGPQSGRRASGCSASATQSPPATPTRRSTTRCAW